MIEQQIAKLRADYARVVEHRLANGDWTKEDEAAIGAAIKAAVAAKDPDMLASWALWLADLSASIAAWELIVRGTMARMRHAAELQRQEAASKPGPRT